MEEPADDGESDVGEVWFMHYSQYFFTFYTFVKTQIRIHFFICYGSYFATSIPNYLLY